MAGAAAKKSQKARQKASERYFPLLVGASALYVLVRLVLRRATATWWHYMALAATSLTYCLIYPPIVEAAGGPSTVAEYLYDVMVLTLFAQTLGAVTDYAWLVMLLVPAFCLFKLAQFCLRSSHQKRKREPEPDEPPPSASKRKHHSRRR